MNIIIDNKYYHDIVRTLQRYKPVNDMFNMIYNIKCDPLQMLIAHRNYSVRKVELICLAPYNISSEMIAKLDDLNMPLFPRYKTLWSHELCDEHIGICRQNVCQKTLKQVLIEVCQSYSNGGKYSIPKEFKYEYI